MCPTHIRAKTMKHLLLNQSRIAVFILMMGLTAIGAYAQSTVYFFAKSFDNSEITLKMNGQEIGELRGSVKKTINPIGPMKIASVSYNPCKKKCVINEEGKVLFSVDFKFTNVGTLAVSELDTEIQLNLTEGSVHYIMLENKGIKDIHFKEISEKDAQKMLNDKKYEMLPEYVQQ